MPKQDDELLTIARCKRLLEECKTYASRKRVLNYLSDAIAEMAPPTLPAPDGRQLTIGVDKAAEARHPETSPFDAE